MSRGLLTGLKYRLARILLRSLASDTGVSDHAMRNLIATGRSQQAIELETRLDTVFTRLDAANAAQAMADSERNAAAEQRAAAASRADRLEAALTQRLDQLMTSGSAADGRVVHLVESIERLSVELARQARTIDVIARRRDDTTRAPIRVVLLINYMQAWDSLAEVFQAMAAAADFDVTVVTIEGRHDEHVAHRALDELDIAHLRLVGDSELGLTVLKSLRPDVIFRQHPWDSELPAGFRTENLGFARLCYVPYYGMQVIEDFGAADQGNNLHTDQPFHRACWRIFCENQAVLEIYRKTSVLSGRNAVVVGHPKLTRLANMRAAEPYWPIKTAYAAGAFRIVWAPHHSVGNDWMNFGSFAMIMDDMLAWAKHDLSVEIVLRPHPSLFGFMRGGEWTTLVSPEQFEHFVQEWNALANTSVDERAIYAPLFVASDLMITDGISFLTEYQIFDKPLVFFERPEHAPFNEIGRLIAGGTLRVGNFADMRRVIDAFRHDGVDPSAAARHDVVAKIVSPTDPATAILETIRHGLATSA